MIMMKLMKKTDEDNGTGKVVLMVVMVTMVLARVR
jgi:hypothetical protein